MKIKQIRLRCPACDTLFLQGERHACVRLPEVTRAPAIEKDAPLPAIPVLARLPSDSAERKEYPMAEGLLDYFPDALAEVSRVSKKGNDQHNPGQPIHWARGKSMDHANCIARHLVDRGTMDIDGMRHSAKMAWRALALLQEELEWERALPMPRGASRD